jgi:hypothetical protein
MRQENHEFEASLGNKKKKEKKKKKKHIQIGKKGSKIIPVGR